MWKKIWENLRYDRKLHHSWVVFFHFILTNQSVSGLKERWLDIEAHYNVTRELYKMLSNKLWKSFLNFISLKLTQRNIESFSFLKNLTLNLFLDDMSLPCSYAIITFVQTRSDKTEKVNFFLSRDEFFQFSLTVTIF